MKTKNKTTFKWINYNIYAIKFNLFIENIFKYSIYNRFFIMIFNSNKNYLNVNLRTRNSFKGIVRLK